MIPRNLPRITYNAVAVPPEKARSYIAQIRATLAQRKDTP